MKWLIGLLPLLIFQISCSSRESGRVAAAGPGSAPPPAVDSTKVLEEKGTILVSELDTILVRHNRIAVTDIPAATFPAHLLPAFDTVEAQNLAADPARVSRQGHQLIFKIPGNPGRVVLETSLPEAEAAYIGYTFLADLKGLKQWLVYFELYEGDGYLLVDQRTGKKTNIFGPPSLAPDKKHFICGSADLLAGYNPNGLQLFAVTPAGPRLVWERQLEKWGPNRLVWVDAQTVLAERYRLNRENDEQLDFARLTFSQPLY